MGDGRCQSDHSDVSSIPPDEARRLDEQLGRLEENVLILSEMNVSQATEHLWDASQLTLNHFTVCRCMWHQVQCTGLRLNWGIWRSVRAASVDPPLKESSLIWRTRWPLQQPRCSSLSSRCVRPGRCALSLSLSLSLSFWISAAASHSSEDTVALQLMSNITKAFVYFNYLNCFRYLK